MNTIGTVFSAVQTAVFNLRGKISNAKFEATVERIQAV